MSKKLELYDEQLDQVAGGAETKVYDVAKGKIYKAKAGETYAYVTDFSGMSNDTITFKKGVMYADGKVHKCQDMDSHFSYPIFKEKYDVINKLSCDYWVE